MPISNNIPMVGFSEARLMVAASVKANTVPLFIGDPGVGKSALAVLISKELELPLFTLIGSTLDPTDVGGMPVLVKGGKGLERIPLDIIRKCCEAPGLLFIDELSSAPGPVQAALLRLILDRVAGDRELHPDTRLMVATNPEEQTPAGSPLSAPLVGRVQMFHLRPSEKEVTDWFLTLGEDGSSLRDEATDFALTCGVQPDLLQIDMPPTCASGNEPWGAPRAWERAVRMRALLDDEPLKHMATQANVGAQSAAAFRAILKLRKDLPSVEAIVADPMGTKAPTERHKQIAAIGLIPRVASVNTWAAWIFTSKLGAEIATACGRHLQMRKDSPISTPYAKEGAKARVTVAAMMRG